MAWINLNPLIKELYNKIAKAHSETVSNLTAVKAEERAFKIMEELSYNYEVGKKFNDIIDNYAISEEELLSISKTVAKFVTCTRRANIDDYLFVDKELEKPRLPYTLK